jgi:hypothetical protein
VLQLLSQRARFFDPPPTVYSDGPIRLQTVRLSVEVGRVGFMFAAQRRRVSSDTGSRVERTPDDLCARFGFELKNGHKYTQLPTTAASLVLRAAGRNAPQVEWPASWPQQPGPNTVFAGFFEVQNPVLHVLASDALVKKAGATMRLYPKVHDLRPVFYSGLDLHPESSLHSRSLFPAGTYAAHRTAPFFILAPSTLRMLTH